MWVGPCRTEFHPRWRDASPERPACIRLCAGKPVSPLAARRHLGAAPSPAPYKLGSPTAAVCADRRPPPRPSSVCPSPPGPQLPLHGRYPSMRCPWPQNRLPFSRSPRTHQCGPRSLITRVCGGRAPDSTPCPSRPSGVPADGQLPKCSHTSFLLLL